jgi:hypothetical protein
MKADCASENNNLPYKALHAITEDLGDLMCLE